MSKVISYNMVEEIVEVLTRYLELLEEEISEKAQTLPRYLTLSRDHKDVTDLIKYLEREDKNDVLY